MNLQPHRTFRFPVLFNSALVCCIFLLSAASCSAQNRSFTGLGDGFSWNDPANWQNNVIPIVGTAFIGSGRSVQMNSATTVETTISIESTDTADSNASLTVNAPLSTMRSINCSADRAFLNVNADIFAERGVLSVDARVSISRGGTLNLNSGTITADGLSLNDNSVFNQNGGHFNVKQLAILNFSNTSAVTIGANDNVTEQISLRGLDGVARLTCNRPINLSRLLTVSDGGIFTLNNGFTADQLLFNPGSQEDAVAPVFNWNAGVISTPRLSINNTTINRSGSGHLDVEDFQFLRNFNIGSAHLTIQENDVVSGNFNISGLAEFPVEVTIETPHTFGELSLVHSSATYQQEPGETEGLTMDRFLTFNFADATLNLGFDSQPTGGADWVLRTRSNSVSQIEDMIADGRIVVTGADFVVERDLATGFTFVRKAVSLGDVNLDGAVNFLDISSFIAVLSTGDFLAQADIDESGEVNFLDISPFIAILSDS